MNRSFKDIEEVLESRAALIDTQLSMISYAIEPAQLSAVVHYALSQRGKRIRSTILTLSCEAVGGNLKQAIVPAVAIEMLHNTSLVMDDIIDHSETRRGKQTINSKWGNNMALIACDVMLSLAIREISKSDINITKSMIHCVSDSMLRLAEGEALELEACDHTLDDYFKIADKKTASLFSAAAEAGALVGGGDHGDVESLKQYGKNIGLAFQIQDDILDFTANKEHLGKPTFIDLKMNRPTLVMLLASGDGLSRERMLSMNEGELLEVLKPSIARAESIARQKAKDAFTALCDIDDSLAKERLEVLCDYVVARTK